MPKTFRRTGHVYQRHPINGTPDGVISNPLAKETGIVGSVFDAGSTGISEADRDKFYSAGAFTPQADYQGRYVRIYDTPPVGSATAAGRTGFRHDDQIVRIKEVDAGGNFIRLEGMRFEDNSTTVKIDIFAAADFTAASAAFPAEPHTSADAGPVVHQALTFPNPSAQQLKIGPFPVGQRNSATSVRISDLYGVLSSIPTEATLEWFLKDRRAYSWRDLFQMMKDFFMDAGWELHQNRGRSNPAGGAITTQGYNCYLDDVVFYSDGEDNEKKMWLRQTLHNWNRGQDGTDTTYNDFGFSWAFFSAWDRNFVPTGANADRNPGCGVNPMAHAPNVGNGNYWAAWDNYNSTGNEEPAWNADETQSMIPYMGLGSNATSVFRKDGGGAGPTGNYQAFIDHPMRDPRGGTFHELDYVFFGDKDEVHLFVWQEGVGMSTMHLGSLEPLPSQIQKSFLTTAITRAGSNSIVRVGTTNPESLPSGPSYQVGDNLQIVGQTVTNGVDWNALSHAGEFIETAFIQAIGAVGAIGQIGCVAKSLLVDNTDTFTINDGEGSNITFYYDVDGAGGGAGTPINVSGDTTAAQVAITTAAAINGSALNITATPNGDFVDLAHNTPNSAPTNVGITEAVNDPGFTVYGMEGSGYGITVDVLNNEYQTGAIVGEDPQPNFMTGNLFEYASLYSSDAPVRVSNRARHGDATYFDHNGQASAQATGCGFQTYLTVVPVNSTNQIDPSQRTNRFGLLSTFLRDVAGDQWRGRMRYFHLLSKKVRAHRLIRDRNGDYYYVMPPAFRFDRNQTTLEQSVIAIGPMPQGLAIPS